MKYFSIFLVLALLVAPNILANQSQSAASTVDQKEELAVALKCRFLKDIAHLDKTNRLKITRLIARLNAQKKSGLLSAESVAWLDKHLLSLTRMLAHHDQEKAAEQAPLEQQPSVVPVVPEVMAVESDWVAQHETDNQTTTANTTQELVEQPEVVFVPATQDNTISFAQPEALETTELTNTEVTPVLVVIDTNPVVEQINS